MELRPCRREAGASTLIKSRRILFPLQRTAPIPLHQTERTYLCPRCPNRSLNCTTSILQQLTSPRLPMSFNLIFGVESLFCLQKQAIDSFLWFLSFASCLFLFWIFLELNNVFFLSITILSCIITFPTHSSLLTLFVYLCYISTNWMIPIFIGLSWYFIILFLSLSLYEPIFLSFAPFFFLTFIFKRQILVESIIYVIL